MALFQGEGTVKTHVSRILTKTGTENRVQVALLVYRTHGDDDGTRRTSGLTE